MDTVRLLSMFAFAILSAQIASAQNAPFVAPYRNPALSVEQRAADLTGRMTLEEKAGQIRDIAPAIPRLGVPAYNWWSEGLHGVARAGYATVFPQAIGMAATWDAPLVRDVADVIGTEFRAKYVETVNADGSSAKYRGLTVWSPNVNIFRDPRWGRGQETYGEDPYLTSRFGVAFIQGLQGGDPRILKTVATVKHFAVHSGPEADRHRENVRPSARDLEETYLPAFRAAVTEAGAQAVMCAYNAVDGVPACGNGALLQERLRQQWKFAGHVVSDCGAISDFFMTDAHRYVSSPERAAAAALKAGTDLFCADFGFDRSTDAAPIVAAVKDGLLPQTDLDAAVRRLFEARIRLGLFDPPGTGPYANITPADNDTPAHKAAALKAAREAMVLLKNDGLLPLKTMPKRIAVIGPNADSVDALVGNYNGTPSHPVTILAGMRTRFPHAEIVYVKGTGWTGPAMETVPDQALCLERSCTARGLTAEEYFDRELTGPATANYKTANAQYRWGRPKREARDSSMRWQGFIVPDKTGLYRFGFDGGARFRIYVDGKQIVDAWNAFDPTAFGEIKLQAGTVYALTVEAQQNGDRGDQRLRWETPDTNDAAAIEAAKTADLVIFAGGLTAKLEGEEMTVYAPGFAGGDRTSLNLPAAQETLLKNLTALGKPTVFVAMSGSALSINGADEHVPAIVEAWYPGGEGGHAVAGLLAGDFSPAGRLPVTFYRSVDQLPPFDDYAMAGRTYRYFNGTPLYPFGYGLSYTHFRYGKITLDRKTVRAGATVKLSVDVTNTGTRDGDEVVQIYVSRAAPDAPIRSLQGFRRIALKTGETKKVNFTLDADAFSVVDAAGVRSIAPGTVHLWVGGGQPVARQGLPHPAGSSADLTIAPNR